MSKGVSGAAVAAVFFMVAVTAIAPVAALQPEQVPGELVEVPVVPGGTITIDGDLIDWLDIPAVETIDGPQPSADPNVAGLLRWQVVASGGQLLVAATITDDLIIAGRNGDQYWIEDSIELYVNFADQAASTYADGIAQLRVSAVDRGNTDPSRLTITGVGASGFDVSGFVFQTTNGWGFEVAIPVADASAVVDGATFGFQIQANGSSGEGRDLKLNWSTADVNDTSYEDPSVFGQAVYVDPETAEVATTEAAEAEGEATVEPVEESTVTEATEAEVDATVAEGVPETIPAEVETPVAEQEHRGRALLIAAIISAITIMVGGLWFERRRKRSESNLAALGTGLPSDGDASEEEFQEMLESILDDEDRR